MARLKLLLKQKSNNHLNRLNNKFTLPKAYKKEHCSLVLLFSHLAQLLSGSVLPFLHQFLATLLSGSTPNRYWTVLNLLGNTNVLYSQAHSMNPKRCCCRGQKLNVNFPVTWPSSKSWKIHEFPYFEHLREPDALHKFSSSRFHFWQKQSTRKFVRKQFLLFGQAVLFASIFLHEHTEF